MACGGWYAGWRKNVSSPKRKSNGRFLNYLRAAIFGFSPVKGQGARTAWNS
jgi:hypothetical protein